MMSESDQAYVNDLVLALEAAQVMADRLGEEVAVLKDFRGCLASSKRRANHRDRTAQNI